MLRYSNLLILMLFVTSSSLAAEKSSSPNPIFRDSVLKSKVDTGLWYMAVQQLDIHQQPAPKKNLQHQKNNGHSRVFLISAFFILLLVVFFKLVFDDFSYALLEGVLSYKKFIVYSQSKKYDSFIAVFIIYILKILLLSMVIYAVIHSFGKNNFNSFYIVFFWKFFFLLLFFFSLKNTIEYVFNFVVQTHQIFKSFFLHTLFIDFILLLILLPLFLVFIYNDNINQGIINWIVISGLVFYAFFNIIRSYQLASLVRIPYKLHFFLYICTFKILPILLLTKFILNTIVAA